MSNEKQQAEDETLIRAVVDDMLIQHDLRNATHFVVSHIYQNPRHRCWAFLVALGNQNGFEFHFISNDKPDDLNLIRDSVVKELQRRFGLNVIAAEDGVEAALEILHLWPNAKSEEFVALGLSELGSEIGAGTERVLHDGTIGRLGPDGASFTRPEVV